MVWRTPRRSRGRLASGERYSPQILSRGKRARSRRTTDKPSGARRVAVAAPAGPAPTTTTSAGMADGVLLAGPDADLAERDGAMPANVGEAGAGRQRGELAGRVRAPHRQRAVMTRHAIARDRMRREPDRGPGDPAPAEVAHDESEAGQFGESAEQRHHRRLREVVEHQRADRHVDRPGPD